MIRRREIGTADLDSVADLLTRGFAHRSRDYWLSGLRRQLMRDVSEGFARFGYMLDHEGTPGGVLLSIYTGRNNGSGDGTRCNLSGWYVEPGFRNYVPLLSTVPQRHKYVTFINISPAHWTWWIIQAPWVPRLSRRLVISPPSAVASGEEHARKLNQKSE